VKIKREMKQTLDGCNPADELVELGRSRQRSCTKRNRFIRLNNGKNWYERNRSGKRSTYKKHTSALAVGQLECCMSVRETAVLPQQLLEQLLTRFQHALQGLSASMMYAGFLAFSR
jgi:hypothetical protein